MQQNPTSSKPPRVTRIARKAFTALDYFLHVEAASGIVLLVAALVALVWANSPFAHRYYALWETPVAFSAGRYSFDHALRFWINDGLMTVFFLVVGIEIRREIHDGSLSDVRQAMLPIAAAIGGVAVPALIYFAVNVRAGDVSGWAVPTATDIALAVGVLALLGRSVPGNVRIFLLTLAIADDIIAVLVIAFCYSSGLHYSGFAIAAAGIVIVIAMQRLGVGSAPAYLVPGVVVWFGLFVGGANPTLAGVVLGLLTPVAPMRRLCVGQGELPPSVLRLELTLHPWVAYAIVPLFVLANAGVKFAALDLGSATAPWVLTGIVLALVVGKPLGVIGVSWLLVRLGVCRLPGGVSWQGIGLAALLAGVGFTMSVLIATLAFPDETTLGVAKFGVLLGSLISGGLGIAWGIGRRLHLQ